MATLAEIRAKLKEQETKTGGLPRTGGDNVITIWNIKEGEQATVLPAQMAIKKTLFFLEREIDDKTSSRSKR